MAKQAKTYKSFTIRHNITKHERAVTVEQYEDLRRTSQNWLIVDRHEDDITQKAEKERPVTTGKTAGKGKEETEPTAN
jgi:hypothetical protein